MILSSSTSPSLTRGHLSCRDTFAWSLGCPLKAGSTVHYGFLLTGLAASFDNISTAPTAAAAKLDPPPMYSPPQSRGFGHVCEKPLFQLPIGAL